MKDKHGFNRYYSSQEQKKWTKEEEKIKFHEYVLRAHQHEQFLKEAEKTACTLFERSWLLLCIPMVADSVEGRTMGDKEYLLRSDNFSDWFFLSFGLVGEDITNKKWRSMFWWTKNITVP